MCLERDAALRFLSQRVGVFEIIRLEAELLHHSLGCWIDHVFRLPCVAFEPATLVGRREHWLDTRRGLSADRDRTGWSDRSGLHRMAEVPLVRIIVGMTTALRI